MWRKKMSIIKKINYKIIIFILMFLPQFLFAEEKPLGSVESICQSYHGEDDFLKTASNEILKYNERRIELVRLMSKGKALGCQQALTDYLTHFNTPEFFQKKPFGFESYLILAYSANLPVAKKIIEDEINAGRLLDWLDIFQKFDEKAYYKSLSQWVERVAILLRNIDHAETLDKKDYGKVTGQENNKIQTPQSIQMWNIMIINKYLNEVINHKIKLTEKEFSNLNIIFAASNQSIRDIFASKMTTIIGNNNFIWILSFRIEPSWVQFRLFPLMIKDNGGFMKRELMWLAAHHENGKMRAMARTTLDKMNY